MAFPMQAARGDVSITELMSSFSRATYAIVKGYRCGIGTAIVELFRDFMDNAGLKEGDLRFLKSVNMTGQKMPSGPMELIFFVADMSEKISGASPQLLYKFKVYCECVIYSGHLMKDVKTLELVPS